MNDSDIVNLDVEFKRYLKILRPYLGQLIEKDVIAVCSAWIQKLSNCRENEKSIRNKYVFALCYQLARGVLEEPFVQAPTDDDLNPLSDELSSDESSTEYEYIVNNGDENFEVHGTKISKSNISLSREIKSNRKIDKNNYELNSSNEETILCHNCPEAVKNKKVECNEEYEYRIKKLIQKLREIKTQNILLLNEIAALKEESKIKSTDFLNNYIHKINTATSVCLSNVESSATLKSLKTKLQNVQDSRNALIESIAELQDKLDQYDEMKRHDIEEVEAMHKLEIIKLKTVLRDEMKTIYDKKLEDLKQHYETTLKEMQENSVKEMGEIAANKDKIITDKNMLIDSKDVEIAKLKNQIEEQKCRLHTVLNKFLENPNEEVANECLSERAHQLEKRLNRLEKSKNKCIKVYETKLASLQREKHLAECSLQLQLVRQRTQVVNEVNNETQAELAMALDKLETKYKEIVATVQATAIQRRMQDQVALESILQATCGDRKQSFDNEITTSTFSNKVGNRSFGDETLGFCLNSDRMGELFERVYIPQRDREPLK